jgi:hypothetical protein
MVDFAIKQLDSNHITPGAKACYRVGSVSGWWFPRTHSLTCNVYDIHA